MENVSPSLSGKLQWLLIFFLDSGLSVELKLDFNETYAMLFIKKIFFPSRMDARGYTIAVVRKFGKFEHY